MSDHPLVPAVAGPHLTALVPKFLVYAEAELQFGRRSLVKYQDCLRQVALMLGDRPVDSYTSDDILLLKSKMLCKQHSVSRQVSILFALKRLFGYCRQHVGLGVLDPESISVPKRPRREVIYLTPEEVARFVAVIPLQTRRGRPLLDGLRFRALVEALLGVPCGSASCCRSRVIKLTLRSAR